MIGIQSMGGVGKSTLLMKIHNQFPQSNHIYDPIVWTVMSEEGAAGEKIQKAIWKKF